MLEVGKAGKKVFFLEMVDLEGADCGVKASWRHHEEEHKQGRRRKAAGKIIRKVVRLGGLLLFRKWQKGGLEVGLEGLGRRVRQA